jgi:hypothetical protein
MKSGMDNIFDNTLTANGFIRQKTVDIIQHDRSVWLDQ